MTINIHLEQKYCAVRRHDRYRVLAVALECGLNIREKSCRRYDVTYKDTHSSKLLGDDLQILERTGIASRERLKTRRSPARL